MQMYNISSHIVKTTWENNVEQLCISIETDLFVGCEQSWWINGICDLGTDISLPPCLIGSRHRVGGKMKQCEGVTYVFPLTRDITFHFNADAHLNAHTLKGDYILKRSKAI